MGKKPDSDDFNSQLNDVLGAFDLPAGSAKGGAEQKQSGRRQVVGGPVVQQTTHSPVVKGSASVDATYSSDFCRTLWKEFDCTSAQCRSALNGRDDVDAESLIDLILNSKFGLVADWREMLSEFLDVIASIAETFDVSLEFESDDDETATATLTAAEFESPQVALKYVPNDDGTMHDVVGTLQAASENRLIFLSLKATLDSDSYCYVLLSPEKFDAVRAACGKRFDEIFATLV